MSDVVTNRDLIELMRRLGLIERTLDGDGVSQWGAPSPLPLPSDAIPMRASEREFEDEIRWHGLHERTSFKIIDQFVERSIDSLTTSLHRLATELGVDSEDARHGVAVLLDDGDFTCTREPESLEVDEAFVLTVDWDRFSDSRISIVAAD